MKKLNFFRRPSIIFPALACFLLISFQNCQGAIFNLDDTTSPDADSLGVCAGVSCSLTPLTGKPAVTTILMALGDQANNQLVVNGNSAQLIAETLIRYSSPVADPKILVVHDLNSGSESSEDLPYVISDLLNRYSVTEIDEPVGGLKQNDVAGYDVVWFNNPGYPMGSSVTRDTLITYTGAVILEGDDLAHGNGFSIDDLTGLHYVDNGEYVSCDNGLIYTDNNAGSQFRVTLDASQFPNAGNSTVSFLYGNDVDLTTPNRDDLQILATAKVDSDSCHDSRPAIVRYLKPATGPAPTTPNGDLPQ